MNSYIGRASPVECESVMLPCLCRVAHTLPRQSHRCSTMEVHDFRQMRTGSTERSYGLVRDKTSVFQS